MVTPPISPHGRTIRGGAIARCVSESTDSADHSHSSATEQEESRIHRLPG